MYQTFLVLGLLLLWKKLRWIAVCVIYVKHEFWEGKSFFVTKGYCSLVRMTLNLTRLALDSVKSWLIQIVCLWFNKDPIIIWDFGHHLKAPRWSLEWSEWRRLIGASLLCVERKVPHDNQNRKEPSHVHKVTKIWPLIFWGNYSYIDD